MVEEPLPKRTYTFRSTVWPGATASYWLAPNVSGLELLFEYRESTVVEVLL